MRRFFLLTVLLFPILANAQDKPAKRSCRILFLNPPLDAPKKLFLFDGVSSREIELPEMNFSDVYQVAGGDAVMYLLPTAVKKVEDLPPGAPTGKVPAAVLDFYIVATADPTNKVVPVQMQIIDASTGKFNKGQMMWYNLTANGVGGQLGTQKLAMKGHSRAVVNAPATGNEAYDVNLSYLIPDDPKFYPVIQTKWVHDPRSRMVIFVYGGANNTAPEVAGFKDFRDAPAKSE